jgi:cytochrome c5
MKKFLILSAISFIVFACSHKTASTAMKTSSATVSHEQFLAGKEVYEANCAKCHKLKDPRSHTPEEWVTWIDKMAPKAKITDEQKTQIYNYVSVNAKGS